MILSPPFGLWFRHFSDGTRMCQLCILAQGTRKIKQENNIFSDFFWYFSFSCGQTHFAENA